MCIWCVCIFNLCVCVCVDGVRGVHMCAYVCGGKGRMHE